MSKSIIQARLICGLLGHRPNLLPVGDQAGAFYARHAPCTRCGDWVRREM